MAFIVAIDGPAGSGKGTITKLEKKKNDEQQWQGCEEMEETACMK